VAEAGAVKGSRSGSPHLICQFRIPSTAPWLVQGRVSGERRRGPGGGHWGAGVPRSSPGPRQPVPDLLQAEEALLHLGEGASPPVPRGGGDRGRARTREGPRSGPVPPGGALPRPRASPPFIPWMEASRPPSGGPDGPPPPGHRPGHAEGARSRSRAMPSRHGGLPGAGPPPGGKVPGRLHPGDRVLVLGLGIPADLLAGPRTPPRPRPSAPLLQLPREEVGQGSSRCMVSGRRTPSSPGDGALGPVRPLVLLGERTPK
jgi:hypothetical protein